MPIDPYTDPDAIQALYTNPDDEIILAEYLVGAAAIQLGLVAASGTAVNTSTPATAEETVSSGGDSGFGGGGGDFGDPPEGGDPDRGGDLRDALLIQ